MPNRFSGEVRAFVAQEKARGITCEAISANVPRVFPGVHISPAGVQRLGSKWRTSPEGEAEQARVEKVMRSIASLPEKGTQCVYVSLVNGKAVMCGAEGYPYCANHRSHIASAHQGSRYPQAQRLF